MDLFSPTNDSLPSSPSSLTSTAHPRCEPDPLDPETNICLARVTTDDRQGISHFFGRNKKATASISEDMFPLLCRTHYQEKQYRWKDDVTAFAAFQCDCILKTLERMVRKTFTDANGLDWPYWCGFELQTQRPLSQNDDTIPAWLRPLCQKSASIQSYTSIGDRDGIRYSFTQLSLIVKSIKTWCLQTKSKIPAIEALPITIGMVDESTLNTAKQGLKDATREETLASTEQQRYTQTRKDVSKMKKAQLANKVQLKRNAVNSAQGRVNVALLDSASTRATVPGKRKQKKGKGVMSPAETDEGKEMDDDMNEPEDTPVLGKKRIILRYGMSKRVKMEGDY